MCEVVSEVKRLMGELRMTQARLVDLLNEEHPYKVTRSEFCTYLNGLNTPKARRAMVDALEILVREQKTVADLVSFSKSL